jgi:Bacteriophage baseplate protein W
MATYNNLTAAQLAAIGQGPSFPLQFSTSGGLKDVALASGVDKINQSIHSILTTIPGERVMNPNFGSLLYQLIFEPNDFVLRDLLYLYTVDALARWEKRINVVSINFPITGDDLENGIVRLQVRYVITATGQSGSFIFPFQRHAESMGGLDQPNSAGPSPVGSPLNQPIVIGMLGR